MTQKNIWNISVKELMEKYQVTEQGLTTARVEYALSDLGETMRPILDAMQEWGTNYKKSLQ